MANQDIVLVRIIDAPVEAVWRAWTDPEVVVRWWGPAGFTSNSARIDLREGGRFVWNMHAPAEMGGIDMYTGGTYTRIEPHTAIDFVQWLSDEAGEPIDPVTIGLPADFPKEIRSSLQFEETPTGTRLTATEFDWLVGTQRDMSEAGLTECIDKLEELLTRRTSA